MNIQTTETATPRVPNTPNTLIQGGDEILETAVRQVMGLDEKSGQKYKDKIQTLLDWARTQTKEHTPANIKWAIRELDIRVGTSAMSEPKISRVARFAYLAMEKNKIDKELQSLEEV